MTVSVSHFLTGRARRVNGCSLCVIYYWHRTAFAAGAACNMWVELELRGTSKAFQI